MRDKDENTDTRSKLLEAACELFARKGYSDCSVSDITEKAGANKASINYYFGSKEKLYQKAWRTEFARAIKKYPVDGGVAPGAPADQRLRGHIKAFVSRLSDAENVEFDIVVKETANPTGLLREVMKKSIDPVRENLESIVEELIGFKIPDSRLRLCCLSIKAQCMDIALCMRPAKTAFKRPVIDAGIDEVAEHIFNFSYAGIKELRQQFIGKQATNNP